MRRRFESIALAVIMVAAAFAAVSASAMAKGNLFGSDRTETEYDPLAWTIMVYLAGDNNLENETIGDLAEMEAAGGSHDGVTIIALVDTHMLTNGTHLLIVDDAAKIDTHTGDVDCDCKEILGKDCGDEELNMGDPDVLQAFIENSITYAPADRYMLILWDHGGGWYGVCWDESHQIGERDDRLTIDEVGNAIAAAEETTGVKLDIIGFDACLMAMIEVAYEIKDLAYYMIASVTGIPFGGWAYESFIENVTKTSGMPLEDLMDLLIDGYVEEYSWCSGSGLGGWLGVGLSVFDLSLIQTVADAVDDLSYALGDGLESGEMTRGTIASAFKSSSPMIQSYGEAFAFPDLGTAAARLAELYKSIEVEATAVVGAVDAAVIACDWVSQENVEVFFTTGMTIYLPVSYEYTYLDYAYDTEAEANAAGEDIYWGLDFTFDTNWDEFILEDFCLPLSV